MTDGISISLRVAIATGQKSPANVRRVRKWGDPIMVSQGFSTSIVGTSNFQAVGLYNKATGFGGVTNFLRVTHADMMRISQMQVEDNYVDKVTDWRDQKMRWLYKKGGTIYFADGDEVLTWDTAPTCRWGTIALGGNLVQVEGYEMIRCKLRGETTAAFHNMARLKGFRASDWGRSLQELLSEGLVHRCYCAYLGDVFGDTPKGIIYSPFFSPLDWDFAGRDLPDAFYLPADWLDDLPSKS